MDNAEEVLQALEEFSKLKPKDIPKELDEYLGYVAKTGDPVYQWHLVKHLFHEKLSNVIKEFYETSPTIDFPPCPNVDPFNYERLKTSLLERLALFSSAPFTVQRICELLTSPRKQYNRVDKFMRAIEKNIIVVSTREPGTVKRLENDESETVLNGIPDNRLSEPNDRIINVCSENLQFSSSEDNSQMPVVLQACVVQQEIEIENSAPTTVITTETKSWCEDNENEKDTDLEIKTDLPDNSEVYVVSTTSSVLISNNELPTTKSTNILFTETDETKNESIDNVKTTSDNTHSTEPIGASTPDSPDSPDPSSSEELCTIDNLTDEPMQQKTDETEDTNSINEDSDETTSAIETKEKENLDVVDNLVEVTEESLLVEESNDSEPSQIREEEISTLDDKSETADEFKTEELSPEQNQPDSSDDSCQSSSADSKESSNVQSESNLENDEDLTNNSEISTLKETTPDDVTEVPTIDSCASPTTEEKPSNEVVIQEIEEEIITEEREIEDSEEKISEIENAITEEEFVSNVTNEETVASDSECTSIQEVTEIKEHTEEVNTSEDASEVVDSVKEVLAEVCEEQESRTEGSIIHATPNISGSGDSEKPNIMTPVEEICVDQTSCSTEDEAMDVDESSNQQMVTSEGENEGEPMDQSDVQSHS